MNTGVSILLSGVIGFIFTCILIAFLSDTKNTLIQLLLMTILFGFFLFIPIGLIVWVWI